MTSPTAYTPEELQAKSDSLPTETPGSITVTGNVEGSIVIGNNNLVGNHNIVYQIHDAHGAVVEILKSKLTVTKRQIPSPPPRAPRGFIGRETNLRELDEYIRTKSAVVIRGQDGIGKTTLVKQAAQGEAARSLPDGVLYVEGVEEYQPLGIADIYQRLFDGIYESVPPLKITVSNAKGYLRDKSPLIILDHSSVPPELLNQLPDSLPQGALLITAPKGTQFSESFYSVDVPPLTSDEAVQLFSEKSGLPRNPANDEAMQKVCNTLNNIPLAIVRTALAFNQNKFGNKEKTGTLEALAINLNVGRGTSGDEVLDAIGRSIGLIFASLTEDEKKMLFYPRFAPGLSVDRPWLESVAGGPATSESLESMELLVANSPRLRLPGDRQQLGFPRVVQQGENAPNISQQDLLDYLTHRLQTSSLDFEFVGAELGNILGYIRARFGGDQSVIDLGRAVDPYLTLHGLWDAWEMVLMQVLQSARTLKDPASEAWALHQLGTRAIGLGNLGEAITNLMDAFQLRGTIGDVQGASYTLHNLRLILPPPHFPPDPIPPTPDPSPLASLIPGIIAGVFLTAALLIALLQPSLTFTRQADRQTFNPIGQEIQYTYTVSNPSLHRISGPILVTDGDITVVCPPLNTVGNKNDTLDWNESITCTGRHSVSKADTQSKVIKTQAQVSNGDGKVISGSQDYTIIYSPKYLSLAIQPDAVVYKAAGDRVNITYLVSNQGQDVVTGPLVITTDAQSQVTCQEAGKVEAIASNGVVTCTTTYMITDGDVKNGSVTITAQARVGGLKSEKRTLSLYIAPSTGLELVKAANPVSFSAPGDKITYTYTITNQQKNPLPAPVNVKDNLLRVDCPDLNTVGNKDEMFDSGEVLTCRANYTIGGQDVERGFVSNTAFASAGGMSSSQQTLTIYSGTALPVLSLAKSADRQTYSQVDERVLYTYQVSNKGSVPIPGPITVKDDLVTVYCTEPAKTGNQDNNLDPGEVLPCYGTYLITQKDLRNGSVTNKAWAQSSNASSDPQTVTISYKGRDRSILPINDNLALSKSASPQFYKQAGDQIQYTYEVRNTGSQPIPGPISIEDDHLQGIQITCPVLPGMLEVGRAVICTGTYTITDADIAAGTVTNTASARAGDGSTSSPKTVTIYEKSLHLDAQATPEAYAQVGESIAYTFTITGRSAVPLQGDPIVIADPLQITCESLDTVGNMDHLLDSDEKIMCKATQDVTQSDIDNGSISLQAEADSGDLQSPPLIIKVSGPAPAPALTLTNTNAETIYNSIGDILHYTYVITNTGNVTLDSTLQVTDDHIAGGAPFDCSAAGPLAPGLTSQCQGNYSITQQDLHFANSSVTNNASAMGSFRQTTVGSPPASSTATCPYPGKPWVPFIVSQGETLATISNWYPGTPVTDLQKANCMGGLDTQPGLTFYVPSPPPTASVSGMLTDSVGSPLAGITVTLVSSSGRAYKTITNGNGYYSFSGLQPGYYSIFRDQFYLYRGNHRSQNYRVIPQ